MFAGTIPSSPPVSPPILDSERLPCFTSPLAGGRAPAESHIRCIRLLLLLLVIPRTSRTRSLTCPSEALAYKQKRVVCLPILSAGQSRHQQCTHPGQDGLLNSTEIPNQAEDIQVKAFPPTVCKDFPSSLQSQHPHLSSAPARTHEYTDRCSFERTDGLSEPPPSPSSYSGAMPMLGAPQQDLSASQDSALLPHLSLSSKRFLPEGCTLC